MRKIISENNTFFSKEDITNLWKETLPRNYSMYELMENKYMNDFEVWMTGEFACSHYEPVEKNHRFTMEYFLLRKVGKRRKYLKDMIVRDYMKRNNLKNAEKANAYRQTEEYNELLEEKLCQDIEMIFLQSEAAKKDPELCAEYEEYKEYLKADFIWLCNDLLQKRFSDEIQMYEDSGQEEAQENFLSEIPNHVVGLYPMARRLKRHFVIHIGSTESGKNKAALKAFYDASSAVYLTSRSFMAYKIYEESCKAGIACSMFNGEESITSENAGHFSCTIEMANLYEFYDVAVIDEAQKIGDEKQGGAWTALILGLCAGEIHVCTDVCAQDILIAMIKDCGDTYEIKKHERQNKVIPDPDKFHFPKSIQEQDALIVISEENVLLVAAELQRNGFKTSILYDSLSYQLQQKELLKFAEGETSVIVASYHTIGQALNLPIRRMVFLELKKIAGSESDVLLEGELRQIAGCTGDRGIFKKVFYTSEYNKQFISEIVEKKESKSRKLKHGYIRFPDTLLSINGKLSESLKKWADIPDHGIYQKEDISRPLQLCEFLEQWTDDKEVIYDFITLLYPQENDGLYELWEKLFFITVGEKPCPHSFLEVFTASKKILRQYNVERLKYEYQVCNLVHRYLRFYDVKEDIIPIINKKNYILRLISEQLYRQALPINKCTCCGTIIPWNYPRKQCKKCYKKKKI